jgi:hypothetical protein
VEANDGCRAQDSAELVGAAHEAHTLGGVERIRHRRARQQRQGTFLLRKYWRARARGWREGKHKREG